MGNEASTLKKSKVEFVRESNHPYLKKIRIFKPKSSNIASFQPDLQIAEVRGCNESVNLLEFLRFSHQNIATLLDNDQSVNAILGNVTSQNKLYFEYFETTLDEIISIRKNSLVRFQELEILRIAQDVLTALSVFQFKHVDHWNIQPSTIFYNSNSKKIVLYLNEAIQGKFASFNILYKNSSGAICTPELQQALLSNDPSIYEQYVHKSDIFQLGVTLLECLTYQDSKNLFSGRDKGFKFNSQELQKRLAIVQTNYSKDLFSLIQDLLVLDPNQRLCSSDLLKKHFITKFPNGVQTSSLFQSFTPTIVQEKIISSPQKTQMYQSQTNFIPSQVNVTYLKNSVQPQVFNSNLASRSPTRYSFHQVNSVQRPTQFQARAFSPIQSRILNSRSISPFSVARK